MRATDKLRIRMRSLLRRRQAESQLESELAFHLEQQAAEFRAAGMAAEEARQAARRAFGGVAQKQEECRDQRGWNWLEALGRDLQFALRLWGKAPVLTIAVLLTLMLGIGASTGIFTVINSVLLNPLPFRRPERLVTLYTRRNVFARASVSFPNFLDWQRGNRTFAAMAAYRQTGLQLTGRGQAEPMRAMAITPGFFALLGVRPAAGRLFAGEEGQFGAAPKALISEGLSRRKFGGMKAAVGATAVLDGRAFTVVGVIPASFHLDMQNFRDAPLYIPLTQWANPLLHNRSAGLAINGIGRLQPGVTLAQAQADMTQVAANLAAAYPVADRGVGAAVVPLRAAVVGDVELDLWLIFGAVAFVLVIACVNVANLLLARATTREREFALRTALGAGPGRLARQLLAEGLLLAAAGGGLGLALAAWAPQALLAALPIGLPRAQEIGMEPRVVVFAALVSLLAAVFFALAPARRLRRSRGLGGFAGTAGRTLGTARRGQAAFTVAEIALATVLLIGAALMVRTMAALQRVNPGFDPNEVMAFGVDFPPALPAASPEQIRAACRQLTHQLAEVPGVRAVSLSWAALPLMEDDEALFWPAGKPRPASTSQMDWALRSIVGPGYLRAMRIRLIRGRFFGEQDDEHAPAVAAVDEEFARKFFPHSDPIGRQLNLANGRTVTIVGMVGHVHQWSLAGDKGLLGPQIYFSFAQLSDADMPSVAHGVQVVLRTRAATATALPAIGRALAGLSPDEVVQGSQSMNEVLANSVAQQRGTMLLLGVLAALALTMAAIGIFGVVSYWAGQRTQEMGLRMALGAQRPEIWRLILGQGMRLGLLGVGAGCLAALALTRFMAALLFGVGAADPVSYGLIAAVLLAVAAAACWLPARRAVRVDPAVALRCE